MSRFVFSLPEEFFLRTIKQCAPIAFLFPVGSSSLKSIQNFGSTIVKKEAEEDLGLSRDVRLEAMFRVSRRMALTGSWYKMDRTAGVELGRDIQYMDTVYTLGAQLNSKFTTTFTSVSLRYSILCRQSVEAGLSLGARWVTADASAIASSDGITVEHAFSGSAPAPLPGFFVSAHVLPSLQLSYNLEYLQLSM